MPWDKPSKNWKFWEDNDTPFLVDRAISCRECQGNNFGGTSFRRWWGAWRRSCLENGGYTKSGSPEGVCLCLQISSTLNAAMTMFWRWTDPFMGKQKQIESKQRVLDSICFLLKVSSNHFTQPIATCHFWCLFFSETGKQSSLPARCESTALVVRVKLKGKTIRWHLKGLVWWQCFVIICEAIRSWLSLLPVCIPHQYRFHEC